MKTSKFYALLALALLATMPWLAIAMRMRNVPPTAIVGAAQRVFEGATVVLDATQSSDPDSKELTYAWVQVAGTQVPLAHATSARAEFVAPKSPGLSELRFEVTVSDGSGSSVATTKVEVEGDDAVPQVIAGWDRRVRAGDVVTLDALAARDPEGRTLTSRWIQLRGPSVVWTTVDGETSSFTAPGGFTSDDLLFELSVSDGTTTVVDLLVIGIDPANAGEDQTAHEGELVVLGAPVRQSWNDGDLTYVWTQLRGPLVTLVDDTTATPCFTTLEADEDAEFEFGLMVTDGTKVAFDSVTIRVEAVDEAPVADAGTDRVVAEKSIVVLDASASRDPERRDLTYVWTQVAGSTVELSDESTATPQFAVPDLRSPEQLEFQVEVSDGKNRSFASVIVTVEAADDAPTVHAGLDRVVTEGEIVTLLPWFARDPEDAELSYTWFQSSGTAVRLENDRTALASFTAPERSESEELRFELSVSDGTTTVFESVTITVLADDDAPIASAGPDATVTEGDAVILDASTSHDPEGAKLTYLWRQVGGTPVTLEGESTEAPEFEAPEGLSQYVLDFEVAVSDGNSTSIDTVSLTVDADNDAPIALAGEAKTVDEGDRVRLDASGSSDPEGEAISFKWKQLSGTAVSLLGARTAQPDFTAPNLVASEELQFQVAVSDGTTTSLDTVTVTVDAVVLAPFKRRVGLSVPSDVAQIAAEQKGAIAEFPIKQGDTVKEDDVICRLNTTLLELEVKRLKALAESDLRLRRAESELEHLKIVTQRARELAKKEIRSDSELLAQELQQELAQIAFEQAKLDRQQAINAWKQAEERLTQRTIRSPLSGVVTHVFKRAGETTEELVPLAEVVQLDPLWIEFDVALKEGAMFTKGATVVVSPAENRKDERAARVVFVSLKANASSHSFMVRAAVPNPKHDWKSGLKMFVRTAGEAPTKQAAGPPK